MKKSSTHPLISVIMAVYNGMPYLEEAVSSILNQTYKNLEFIIVDDASTDGSFNYLKTLKDKRIKLIQNKKNLGLAVSLNIALKRAQGEFIARMDADDISLPDRLDKQIKFMRRNQQVDICGAWAILINQNKKEISRVHYPTSDKEIKKTLRKVTPIIHPTWFMKKKVYHDLKGYDPKWDYVEDYEFLIRARKFKMANLPNELLLWRSQENRRSSSSIQQMYLKSFKLKWKYLVKGKLDIYYVPYIVRNFLTAYILPTSVKIFINKKTGLL